VRWRVGPRRRAAEAEPDSGASPSQARRRETSLIGGPRLSARERRREGACRVIWAGGWWAARKRERKRGEGGKKAAWAWPRGREERAARARPQGRNGRGTRKRRVGRAQLGNKRKEERHLNAFGFEFET
jgi:hypothetical protein